MTENTQRKTVQQLFPNGYRGLADSRWSGVQGSVAEAVGIDAHSQPGTLKVHQKLSLDSGEVINERCDNVVNVSDGSRLWFSSESGKIWREVEGVYTLAHTTTADKGLSNCFGAIEYETYIYWATEKNIHRIAVSDLSQADWEFVVEENFGEFENGGEIHPMAIQNLRLYVADKHEILAVQATEATPDPATSILTTFGTSVRARQVGFQVRPSGDAFPSLIASYRANTTASSTITQVVDIPDIPNITLAMVTYSVRTNNTSASGVDTATIDGVSINLTTSGSGNFGNNRRDNYSIRSLPNPPKGENTVTVNFDSANENNILHIFILNNADIISDTKNLFENFNVSSYTTVFPSGTGNFRTKIVSTFSETTTHTLSATEVFNTTFSTGRDSSQIFRDSSTAFLDQTAFNVEQGETILTLAPFDIDILVGTEYKRNKGRILRWDTFADSWSAEDTIYEQGVRAFIQDDNFMYAYCGKQGQLYFYNGERLEKMNRIRGDWGANQAEVKHGSVAFWKGLPVFALSTVTGTPCKMGVYTFGSYGPRYQKIMDLAFPIGETYNNIEFGGVVADGEDLYVSTNAGVFKLDYTAKYEHAHIETMQLTDGIDRSLYNTKTKYHVNYVSLPENTDVSIQYRGRYDQAFTAMDSVNDTKHERIDAKLSVPNITSLQLRFDMTVAGNNAPEIENVNIV